jgi:hypothetical protein
MTDVPTGELQTVNLPLEWRAVDSMFIDQIIGFTHADGIGRIVLGQLEFRPNLPTPVGAPVMAMLMTQAGMVRFRDQLTDLIKNMDLHGRIELDAQAAVKNG